ncbi:hypothetical protein CHUAL_004910 [Chamberlinius hualienensis]
MAAHSTQVQCGILKRVLQLSPAFYQSKCNIFTSSFYLSSRNENVDEEMKIRNISRMPKHRQQLMDNHLKMPEILYDYQTTVKYQRKLYAKFGKESGIDPSISWPSKEEVQEKIEEDRVFEPPLQESLEKLRQLRSAELKDFQQRQSKIEAGMANLAKWMAELQKRKDKKEAEVVAAKAKKDRLIEEVRQFFGYRLNPRDPKFQEVLEKKEKEERKAIKEAKKKDKFNLEMAKIAAMAQMKLPESKTTENENKPNEISKKDDS